MSVARKNSRRLKKLRRRGVPIDGHYRVTGNTVAHLGIVGAEPVDSTRDVYRLDSRLQTQLLERLA